jgi:hypothetical protein
MSDIKLFRLTNGSAKELVGKPVVIEKQLQSLIEQHLESFLKVRFVASNIPPARPTPGVSTRWASTRYPAPRARYLRGRSRRTSRSKRPAARRRRCSAELPTVGRNGKTRPMRHSTR